MHYKKQKAIRSNKKDVIYDLMTDLGLATNPNDRIDIKKGRCCSFLILVDYLLVLSLDKVDSVKH